MKIQRLIHGGAAGLRHVSDRWFDSVRSVGKYLLICQTAPVEVPPPESGWRIRRESADRFSELSDHGAEPTIRDFRPWATRAGAGFRVAESRPVLPQQQAAVTVSHGGTIASLLTITFSGHGILS